MYVCVEYAFLFIIMGSRRGAQPGIWWNDLFTRYDKGRGTCSLFQPLITFSQLVEGNVDARHGCVHQRVRRGASLTPFEHQCINSERKRLFDVLNNLTRAKA